MSDNKEPKKAVRFLLLKRPQRDPLAADIDAPQNILVPKDGSDLRKIRNRLPDFDPQIFGSETETKKGMLERAHDPDKLIDPDILQAMSKDFDYQDPNNLLDDDFMDQAGGLIEDDEETLEGMIDELFEDEPEIIRFDQNDAHDMEISDTESNGDTKSVFTNFSMTSSVMRRNQGLQQIDEHFERLYEKEYADDTDIGPLDLNEVKGDELLTSIDQIRQLKKEVKIVRKRNHGDDYEPEVTTDHHQNAIIGDDPAAEEEDLVEVEFQRRENRVDCESVLSYASTLYNHPKLIVEPRRQRQSSSKETPSVVAPSTTSHVTSILSKLSVRSPDETSEAKHARKKALKAYRHERRQERKQNQQIFKKEKTNLLKQQQTRQAALKL